MSDDYIPKIAYESIDDDALLSIERDNEADTVVVQIAVEKDASSSVTRMVMWGEIFEDAVRGVLDRPRDDEITSREELRALEPGSVVRHWWGSGRYDISQVWHRSRAAWTVPGSEETFTEEEMFPDRPIGDGEHWVVLHRAVRD